MSRRYRHVTFTIDDELYFSNGPQRGEMLVGVDYIISEDGVTFGKDDVVGVSLSLQIGNRLVPMAGYVGDLVADWTETPGNLQLLARKVEWAEERDPTPQRGAA